MNKDISENFYKEVSDSLKLVFDLTSRIDERMKIVIAGNTETKEKIERLASQYSDIITRISLLESKNTNRQIDELKEEIKDVKTKINDFHDTVDNSKIKMAEVEKDLKSHSYKWTALIDFIFKVAIIVIGGVILFKLGIK